MVESFAENNDADCSGDQGITADEWGECGRKAALAEGNLLEQKGTEFAEAEEGQKR